MKDKRKGDANDQLPRLREEIERAWNVRRDILVHRLAEEHPAVADELYAFFADVIEAEDDMEQGRKHPERAETDRRVREYLEREGYRRATEVKAAAKAAPTTTEATATPMSTESSTTRTPTTFVALLKRETGKSLATLATAMDVTPSFLMLMSDNGPSVPLKAQNEIIRRAKKTVTLTESEMRASFAIAPSPMQLAASRAGAFKGKKKSYADLVRSSDLDPARKKYWLALE